MNKTKNIRILYLLTDSDFGGTEASVMRLAYGMKQRGYEISICSIKQLGHMARNLSSNEIKVMSLDLPSSLCLSYPLLFLFALRKWGDIIKQEEPDILHSFLFQSNLLSAITALFKTKEKAKITGFIHSLRCIERNKPRWRIFLDRWILGKADEIIAVSDAVRQKYIQREKINPDKIRVVYHGIEKRFMERRENASESNNLRESLGFLSKETIIGTVTRLHSDKGVDILIKGTALAVNAWPNNLRLMIIGGGPDEPKLMRLAQIMGIRDRIIFAGFQSDVYPWILSMDIFCLTSREEGLPQSLLEAMALAKPVIATNVGGVREILNDHVCGQLIPSNDPEALCNALLYYLKNPVKAKIIGSSGRERIRQRFLLDQTLDNIESIYNKYTTL